MTGPDGVTGEAAASELERLRQEVQDLREQRDAAWEQLRAMRASASWRLTWPLRRLSGRWAR
jgi:hypothetical protein